MPYEAELNLGKAIPSGGGGREFVNHKLSPGDNLYRILPPFGTNHGGSPFAEISLHWFVDNNGNKRPLSCSKGTERFCPVCDEANNLYKEKQAIIEEFIDEKTKRINWKIVPKDVQAKYNEVNDKFSAMRAQRGYYYNALDSSGRVGVLRLPKTAATKLGELIQKAVQTYGFNPLSLTKGATFNIIQKKTGPAAFNVEYEVEFVTKPTQTAQGTQLLIEQGPAPQNVMDNYENLAYDTHAMYPTRTAQELKRAMLGDAKLWAELDAAKEASRASASGETTATPAAKAEELPAALDGDLSVQSVTTEAPAPVETPAPAVTETAAVAETPAPVAVETPAANTMVAAASDEDELAALRDELGV